MIVVDTTIWIDATNRKGGPEARELDDLLSRDDVATTDIVMAEVLQGTSSEREFRRYRESLAALHYLPAGRSTWLKAAELSFQLRRKGLSTPLPDLVIATVALENDCSVYTNDPDFERVPGLKLHKVGS